MKKTMKATLSIVLAAVMLFGTIGFVPGIFAVFAEDEPDSSFIDINTDDPFNPIYTDEDGKEVDMDELYAELAEEDSAYFDSIVSSYDARTKNRITSVKNQNPYGTCWAHAAMNCLEADAITKGYFTTSTADFSEAHLVWFANNPRASSGTASAQEGTNNTNTTAIANRGGNPFMTIGALSRWEGAAKESDYAYPKFGPYTDSDRYNTGTGVVMRSGELLSSYDDIKQWVMDHGSVYITYYADNGYYLNSSTGAYYTGLSNGSNHAVSVIGWNDNYPKSNFKSARRPAHNGAWLVKNSWGTDWGNSGYFWLSYDEPIYCAAGYTVSKKAGLLNNYTYNGDFCGNGCSIYRNGTRTIQLANVFQAKQAEALSKVAFMTAQPDLTARITVYTFSGSVSGPTSGTLVSSATKSVKLHNVGYHTVDLAKKVELTSGQKFSVVIEFTSSADKNVIYYYQELANQSSVACRSGESWTYQSGKWADNTGLKVSGYQCGNNFIQAITESSSTPTPPTPTNVKLSASATSLTLNVGETKTVRVSLTGDSSGLTINANSDKTIVTAKWTSSSFTTSADLQITGVKAGSQPVRLTLFKNSSGEILDTLNISVTVKSSGPVSTEPAISIRGYSENEYVAYKTTLIFNAVTENMPSNATIRWYANGVLQDVDGTPVSVNKATADFTLQAVLMQNGKTIAQSGVVNVYVRSGFISRLIAFIREIFGLLPVIEK